jgi:16S rRNA (uracil1498-N3)-methyltransferase
MSLLIGLLKQDQFESVLRVTAELGVSRVCPVVCERSVPRPDKAGAGTRMPRWRRILCEATKVSGSVRVPELSDPVAFRDVRWDELPEQRYAALLGVGADPIATARTAPGRIVFAVGPEGDWTDGEAAVLIERGFAPISLGPRILRASTAAIAGCAWFRMSAESGRGM